MWSGQLHHSANQATCMIQGQGGINSPFARPRRLRSGDARLMTLSIQTNRAAVSQKTDLTTRRTQFSLGFVNLHQSSQILIIDFYHAHPHSRLAVSPKTSRSFVMKISMTSFAVAMLTGGAVARYCTAGLKYCGPTLKKIGTLVELCPEHESYDC